MRTTSLSLALTAAVLLSTGASAATPPKEPQTTASPLFDIGFLSSGVSDETSVREGIGRGYGLELGGGVLFHRVVSLTAELDLQMHSDDRSFSEETTGGTMDSSATSFGGGVLVGLHSPLLPLGDGGRKALSASVRVGYLGFGGHRSISNCIDCSSESIELKGGLAVEPGIALHFSQRVGVNLSYRFFTGSSDVRNSLLVRFGVF